MKIEISELMNKKGVMYNWANKVQRGLELSEEEQEISEVVDAWAKEIGVRGTDPNNEIAEYIRKVVEPEVFNPDDRLLNALFNIGSIGEFDEKAAEVLPENTLKVYEAVRGGNVPKSYIDPAVFTVSTVKLQCETEIKYSDLRKNGYKSIAKLTELAEEALQNEKYFRLLNAVDNALATGKENDIAAGGANLTMAAMDNLTTYLLDRGSNPQIIGLTKYTNKISKMDGFEGYLSEDMKNELNRNGRIAMYSGVAINGVSSARKTGHGQTLVPDKRILGIADKVGDLDMRGELRVLQTMDNNNQKVHLIFTGYDFDYVLYRLDKMARITLS
ncbi:hypothetical protein [Clostridium botulinum]|uniref:hypothetical protein n=1 Tax=Clostridium botulinum TaxID=1491 RepID=UPI001748773C|nr:hypothetical protein [Clostridium botulinum]MBD5589186.1 hypothetical protein [Clostridium botulinum]